MIREDTLVQLLVSKRRGTLRVGSMSGSRLWPASPIKQHSSYLSWGGAKPQADITAEACKLKRWHCLGPGDFHSPSQEGLAYPRLWFKTVEKCTIVDALLYPIPGCLCSTNGRPREVGRVWEGEAASINAGLMGRRSPPRRGSSSLCVSKSDRLFTVLENGTFSDKDPSPQLQLCKVCRSGRHAATR